MAYATITELDDKLGRTPANAQELLDRASRDVDRALLCAVYDQTDADVIDALREATLEQIATGLGQGDTTGTGATRAGGFTLGRLAVQPMSGDADPGRIGRLWQPAWQILLLAGLTGYGPQQTC